MKTTYRFIIALIAVASFSLNSYSQRQTKLYIDDNTGHFTILQALLGGGGGTLTFPIGTGTIVTEPPGSPAGTGMILQPTTPGTAQTGNFNISGSGTIGTTLFVTDIEDGPVGLNINTTTTGVTTIGNATGGTTINGTLNAIGTIENNSGPLQIGTTGGTNTTVGNGTGTTTIPGTLNATGTIENNSGPLQIGTTGGTNTTVGNGTGTTTIPGTLNATGTIENNSGPLQIGTTGGTNTTVGNGTGTTTIPGTLNATGTIENNSGPLQIGTTGGTNTTVGNGTGTTTIPGTLNATGTIENNSGPLQIGTTGGTNTTVGNGTGTTTIPGTLNATGTIENNSGPLQIGTTGGTNTTVGNGTGTTTIPGTLNATGTIENNSGPLQIGTTGGSSTTIGNATGSVNITGKSWSVVDGVTSTVTATNFSGALTGNVTGNVSGTANNVTGIVAVANGGTGLNGSTAANGTLLIGNGTGYTLATLTPTANQVNVVNTAGSIQLSLPQSIDANASPGFRTLALGSVGNTGVLTFKGSTAGTTTIQTAPTAVGAYTLPATAPTDGQVLSSLATGVMSWTNNIGGSATGDVTLTPASSARNTVTPTGNFVPLTLNGAGAGTADLLDIKNASGNNIATVTPTLGITVGNPSGPNQGILRLYSTNGTPVTIAPDGGAILDVNNNFSADGFIRTGTGAAGGSIIVTDGSSHNATVNNAGNSNGTYQLPTAANGTIALTSDISNAVATGTANQLAIYTGTNAVGSDGNLSDAVVATKQTLTYTGNGGIDVTNYSITDNYTSPAAFYAQNGGFWSGTNGPGGVAGTLNLSDAAANSSGELSYTAGHFSFNGAYIDMGGQDINNAADGQFTSLEVSTNPVTIGVNSATGTKGKLLLDDGVSATSFQATLQPSTSMLSSQTFTLPAVGGTLAVTSGVVDFDVTAAQTSTDHNYLFILNDAPAAASAEGGLINATGGTGGSDSAVALTLNAVGNGGQIVTGLLVSASGGSIYNNAIVANGEIAVSNFGNTDIGNGNWQINDNGNINTGGGTISSGPITVGTPFSGTSKALYIENEGTGDDIQSLNGGWSIDNVGNLNTNGTITTTASVANGSAATINNTGDNTGNTATGLTITDATAGNTGTHVGLNFHVNQGLTNTDIVGTSGSWSVDNGGNLTTNGFLFSQSYIAVAVPSGTNDAIAVTNGGSGNDITGNASNWSITKFGAFNTKTTLTSVGAITSGTSSGAQIGSLVLGDGATAFTGTIKTVTPLTVASHTYTLPDKSGTFAMLSDVGSGGIANQYGGTAQTADFNISDSKTDALGNGSIATINNAGDGTSPTVKSIGLTLSDAGAANVGAHYGLNFSMTHGASSTDVRGTGNSWSVDNAGNGNFLTVNSTGGGNLATTSGTVGIGTASPSSLLSVGAGTGALTVDASGNLATSGNISISTEGPDAEAANAITVSGSKTFFEVTGAATGDVAVTVTSHSTGQLLILYNHTTGGHNLSLNAQLVPPSKIYQFVYYGGNWLLMNN